jgi:SulP family sulfate permease
VHGSTDPSTPDRRPYAERLPDLRQLLPSRADYAGAAKTWRADALAGVTVGVVAVPLALAFGVTTGLGAAAGLVTAVIAGLVAAVFGGSHLQVSGPTGAMTVVLVPVVSRFGAEGVYAVAILAGIVLVVMGAAGFGRAVAYIPWPVVEGFTLGIAVIIFLQQVPLALAVDRPEGESTVAIAVRAVAAIDDQVTVRAALLVLGVVALMVGLPRLRRTIPASLAAVVLATVVAELFDLGVPRIGEIPSSLAAPRLPDIGLGQVADLMSPAVAVAALAAIESLLCAKVADGMADTRPHHPDRELFGQGLGNVAVGLFGGMPSTGAIARTAVNVRAGGRTRLAAIVHSLLLLGVVYLGASLVARIPLAALAGVLMFTAWRMVERHRVLAVLRSTRSDAAVLVLTALATVVFDLVVAVEIGVAVAALLALRQVARTTQLYAESVPDHVEVDEDTERSLLHDHIAVLRLSGSLFFGAAQWFLDELTAVTDVKVVILRFGTVQVLDATGANVLGEIVADMEERGMTVLFCSLRPEHVRLLSVVGAMASLADERHAFPTLDEAIAHAQVHVRRLVHAPTES